mgnify:CR=1 FL=1
MGYLSRGVSGVGGRRVVAALGVAYVAGGVGLLATNGEFSVNALLLGASGLVLLYATGRLSQTSVRPDLFPVVAVWCLRAIGVMVGIVVVGLLADGLSDPVSGFVVLPALASVAGLGVGYHDARARTRTLDAEDRRREAERYSRELQRYETIVETVNDGIFVVDGDGRFTLVNDAYVELVGYDREELLGSPASLVAAAETDVSATSEKIRRDLRTGTAETKGYESTIRTASGELLDVESTVASLPEQGEDGRDADVDKVVVVRDVTERNERERRLERQNERLESFAGMLAHELRNPVTVGQIYSQQLPTCGGPEATNSEATDGRGDADSTDSRDTGAKAVEYVTEAFDRIENMIDVMLVVARGREAISESVPVSLPDAVREAWDEVDSPDATLVVESDRTIRADETYVRHLFRNVFENSVEHGSPNPRSRAHDDAVERDDGGVTVTVGDLPTGFYVADDGVGIPDDRRDAVFDEGYTTANERGGMGLGLTFVDEMADVYDWECSVTESESGGARFEFENVTGPRDDAE